MEENKSYGVQPDVENQPAEQTYGAPQEQPQEAQQTYGVPQGQPQETQQTYGQTNQQAYGQAYGQANQQAYGQTYGQANQQAYGQNMGYAMPPVGPDGQPLKNNYAMKMVFSILEILCCCMGNVVTLAMGIVGCIFSSKANKSYQQGDGQNFKSQSKTANICLWIGLGFVVLQLIVTVISFAIDAGKSTSTNSAAGGADAEVYVQVDGCEIGIPSTYAELEDMGFSVDSYNAGTTIDGGDFDFLQMTNEDGEYVMWCWFYNDSSTEKAVEECRLIGVDVDSNCENYQTYRTGEGLSFDSTAEDFIEAYGEPGEHDYEDGRDYYEWYFDNGSDVVWRVMEVTFIDGVLYDIDVDYKQARVLS